MYCETNSNNFQDNCVINENKNCCDFSDYKSSNSKCNTNNSNYNNSFNFSGYLPIIIVIIIFVLFFCNNNNKQC